MDSRSWWPRYQSRNDERCTAFNSELDQLLENAQKATIYCRDITQPNDIV